MSNGNRKFSALHPHLFSVNYALNGVHVNLSMEQHIIKWIKYHKKKLIDYQQCCVVYSLQNRIKKNKLMVDIEYGLKTCKGIETKQ